jgi:methylisocitrate lyase
MGYTAAIYPLSALRAAMKAAEEVLATLRKEGTQRAMVDRMQSRAELYDLIGYQQWEARDAAYFTGPG